MNHTTELATVAQLLRAETPADTTWSSQQWQALQPHLRWHRVEVRLASRLLPLLPDNAKAGLMTAIHSQLQRTGANIDTLCRITRALDEHGLRYLSIKGPALSQRLYGNTRIKQSADIDILVASDDVPAAILLLAQLGIEPEQPFPRNVSTWKTVRLLCKDWSLRDKQNNVHVELHWRVENNPFLLPTDFDDWYARKETVQLNDTLINVMSLEDTVIHILVHGARSMWTRLHWLADFDALLRCTDIDWLRVSRQIEALKLTQLLASSLALAHQLLGSPTPQPLRTLTVNISERQQQRCEQLQRYALDAMLTRKHHTSLTLRHSHLLLTPGIAFWLYEFATFFGPHHPDVLRLQLPIYLFPLYVVLRPWFVIERRLEPRR